MTNFCCFFFSFHFESVLDLYDRFLCFFISVLNCKDKIQTGVYRFKSKRGSFLHVRSTCFSFRNPWTKEIEYIVSTNTIVP